MKKWFKLSYKSLRETVVYLQGKRKEKEAEMLARFQFGSFSDTMEYIESLFRQNKHLKLHRSKIFRAWYKHQIDYMTKYPDIYRLSMSDGSPFDKDRDPYYDPKAPAWSEYALKRDYDDEDEDDLLDWDPFAKENEERKRWSDAISIGYGFALGNTLFGGSSGDSSGDGDCGGDCGG